MGRCSHCQKPFGRLKARVRVRRHNREDAKNVVFCSPEHAAAWRRSLGKRFVVWETKSW